MVLALIDRLTISPGARRFGTYIFAFVVWWMPPTRRMRKASNQRRPALNCGIARRHCVNKKPRILLVQPTTIHLDGTPHKTPLAAHHGIDDPADGGTHAR